MKTKLFTFIIVCLFLNFTASAQTWQSEKVVVGEDGCLSYPADNEGNRIPDFSYAGYQYGEVPIPDIETKITISPISGDNTQHIQNAINQVAAMPLDADGFRGSVLLEAGTYDVHGTIYLNASGVVLRGSGDGENPLSNTVISGVGNTPNQRDIIRAGGNMNWNNERWKGKVSGTQKNITSNFVQVGSYSFDVENTDNLAVGDNIIIYHSGSQAWVDALGGGGSDEKDWDADKYNILYNRVIKSINGNTITVDVPVYNHLDRSLSQSYIYKYDRSSLISNIGIEDIRIDIQHTGENENHARNAVRLQLVENAWVRNTTFLHFILSGVITYSSNLVTVENCRAIEPRGQTNGGRFYNFNCEDASNQILFKDCYANKARHAYISNGTTEVSGMVMYNCESEDPITSSEGHRQWTTGILFDNFKDYGSRPSNGSGRVLGLYNRGSWGSTEHGWSSAHSVAWNCDVRRDGGSDGRIIVQKPPTAQNYAIGCKGIVNGSEPHAGPAGFVEGTNQDGLFPNSLYEAQLNCRLNQNTCTPAVASVEQSAEGNVAENVLDGSYNTRWSGEGLGEWLRLCFDDYDSIPLEGISIAFYEGDTRNTYFDIQVSMDGNNWTTVLENQTSSGQSTELESFTFDLSWARYLRYVGKGNSENSWNSLFLIEIDTANVPFNNTPHPIPGIVQAQDYDLGGSGIAYYDNSEGNAGGQYRNDDADIEPTTDDLGTYKIGWIRAGEWLNYTCEVESDGYYDFDFRVSSPDGTGRISLYTNNQKIIDDETIVSTGDWENWTTQTFSGIYLEAGKNVLRVYIENQGFNLNYIEVESSNVTSTDEMNSFKVSVLPNPSQSQFIVSSDKTTIDKIILTDLNGKLVLTKNINANRTVFGNTLKPGVYLLSVFKKGSIKHFKIIKQ